MTDLDLLRAALPAYEFEDVLGRGAWGVVIAARHRRLERQVAVKMLPLALTQDLSVRRRFATEARLLATLDHPHVVRIHDYIEQDDVCALVMERLTGGTLAERMRLGRMQFEQASAIELATLNGLEHAHQHGVLHRDIKPENLMFAADGVLKITDFGIATVLGDQAERLTATGVAMGTPAYMAPEQLDDAAQVGEQTDVWAAAAVYYELLTGAVPYPSRGTLRASLLARARDDPTPIRSVAPDVPADIGRAVMRALDRDPAKRFATSGEFAAAVEQAGDRVWGEDWLRTTGAPVYKAAPRSSSGGTTTGAVTPGVVKRPRAGRRTLRGRRRANLVLAAAVAVVLAAGTVVGVLAFTGDSKHKGGTSDAGAGLQWGSWIGNDVISKGVILTGNLGPVPKYWGNRLAMGINLNVERTPAIGPHFGNGIAAEFGFSGDPIQGPGWHFHLPPGAHPAADAIRKLESQGSMPYVTYYVQRLIGGRTGNDASEKDILKQLISPVIMKAYWADVTELLKELGSLNQPVPINVEPGVSSTVESQSNNDATAVRTIVNASGDPDLAGLPDNFAGWTQAWVKLRDKYAPKAMLGMSLEPWAAGDYLVPWSTTYKNSDIVNWTKGFGKYYRTLGTRFDFINYIVSYGEAGKLTKDNGVSYLPTDADFSRLLAWVLGISQNAQTRVVLESVPVGNTVMNTDNNTKFHWRDGYAQWLLGGDNWANLDKMRQAGVIGVVFGFGGSDENVTCPCDAANDGQTNGVRPNEALPPGKLLSTSSDDDGGYLVDHISAYLKTGGIALT